MFGFEMVMNDVVKDFIMIYGDFMVFSVENKIYGEVFSFDKVWIGSIFYLVGVELMKISLNGKCCLV